MVGKPTAPLGAWCQSDAMSAARNGHMTLQALLDRGSRQEFKHEFDGFHPVGMTGVTAAHSAIQFNLVGLLFNRRRGHRCQAYGSDLKIQVVGRIRYPDAFILRSPMPPGTTLIQDPVVVFELLSPGTSYKDRIEMTMKTAIRYRPKSTCSWSSPTRRRRSFRVPPTTGPGISSRVKPTSRCPRSRRRCP
jgi:hypothetical protein